MGKLVNILRGQDQLGSGVSLNYKGSSQYGTITGGCLSLCTTIFFTLFIVVQLYACFFAPSYNQEVSMGFLSKQEAITYDVPTAFFLPTFSIVSNVDLTMADLNEPNWITNDKSYFFWTFVQTSTGDKIPTANCKELIGNMTDISEGEKESMINEIQYPDFTLCPNTTQFQVQGGQLGKDSLYLRVAAIEDALDYSFLSSTLIYTADIVRYFNADDYSKNGYQSAIILNEDVVFPALNLAKTINKSIAQSEISLYDFTMLDTSAITIFNLAKTFDNYMVADTKESSAAASEQSGGQGPHKFRYQKIFEVKYMQSRIKNEYQWSINSLDIVLGLVGGLSGIVWGALFLICGGYENFKFKNSLIGGVYPTSPQDDFEDSDGGHEPLTTESEAKKTMMRSVSERGKYWYTYSEYLLTSILKACCCCCHQRACYKTRRERLQRHEDASERLADEIDIVKLLYVQRVGQFIAKLVLSKHQRALVSSFKKYQVDDLGNHDTSVCSSEVHKSVDQEGTLTGGGATSIQREGILDFDQLLDNPPPSLNEDQLKLLREISANFSIDDSPADLGILYEVTGFKGESQSNFQFWDNYADFDDLGGSRLIRSDKNEELMAKKSDGKD